MILSYLVWELDVNNKMCIVIKSDLPHNCLVALVNVSANNTNWRETQNPNDWHFKTNRLSRWDIQFACNLPTGYPTQRKTALAGGAERRLANQFPLMEADHRTHCGLWSMPESCRNWLEVVSILGSSTTGKEPLWQLVFSSIRRNVIWRVHWRIRNERDESIKKQVHVNHVIVAIFPVSVYARLPWIR